MLRDMLGQQDLVSGGSRDTDSAPLYNGARGTGANGATQQPQPLILVTAAVGGCCSQLNLSHGQGQLLTDEEAESRPHISQPHCSPGAGWAPPGSTDGSDLRREWPEEERPEESSAAAAAEQEDGEQVEEIDGIKYRILAAVTKPVGAPPVPASAGSPAAASTDRSSAHCVIIERRAEEEAEAEAEARAEADQCGPEVAAAAKSAAGQRARVAGPGGSLNRRLGWAIRRKSSALVTSLAKSLSSSPEPSARGPNRRLSILELTRSPPPDTLLEVYLNERRRSSTHSAKQVQLEQQTTFETNYCQRQQYFKDLNLKLINHDKKLLNVVANRGQIHRHSVDIAQLPLHLAQAKAHCASSGLLHQQQAIQTSEQAAANPHLNNTSHNHRLPAAGPATQHEAPPGQPLECYEPINQLAPGADNKQQPQPRPEELADAEQLADHQSHTRPQPQPPQSQPDLRLIARPCTMDKRSSISSRGDRSHRKSRTIIRRFQRLDQTQLNSTPAPDVKIGQRVSYKEYYGNEFGTIRWIGRVPQICPDWTAGIEFDNAIGEGDGSLLGRRYFTAKDCFAKFLPLNEVAFVDQHVGRPEPGTMISVMSAAVQPGQMISIQRVSTVHVQNCFLNAPHQVAGADILAVNTRLHCQCPSCGPCAHIIKPPRTQRLSRSKKNATHMCQFSTYTCCGMKSQEEAVCAYKGNKIASLPPPMGNSSLGLPPIGNSWIEGAGYLTSLQAAQSALMPEEYRMGVAPEDRVPKRSSSKFSSRRSSGRQNHLGTRDCSEFAAIPIVDNHDSTEPLPNLAVACDRKTSPDNNNNNKLQEEKNLAVVHRDSIENRYLFPTEEPIDSTLEADLEDLSQARYGRQLYSSRNILKSLRSLVSCLNVGASNSELDRRSEDTLRYSEYAKSRHNKSMPTESSDSHKKNSDYQESEKACYYSGPQSENKNTNGGINQVMKGQISSSSDCGFSSASQNSINFFTKCPTALASEADKEDFISQLASITDEDLTRLKRALYEPKVTTNYFLNNTSVNLMSNGTRDMCEDNHLFAEKLQRLFSTPDFGCEQSYKSLLQASQCCKNKNQSTDAILDMGADLKEKIVDDNCYLDKTITGQQKTENDSRSSTSGSINLSSCDDSLVSTATMGIELPQQHHETTNGLSSNDQIVDDETLSNAFQLKLTLSINSEGNKFKAQLQNQKNQPETVSTSRPCSANDPNLSGSTLKINIVSNTTDPIDHTNINSRTVTQQ